MNCPQMLWVSGSQCHLNRLWENLLKCWGENWLWNYCCHLTSFKKKVLNILILDNNIVLFIINCGLHIMKLRTWDFTGHLVEYDKSKVWTFKLCENLKISFGGRIIIQVSLYRHWFFVFFFFTEQQSFLFCCQSLLKKRMVLAGPTCLNVRLATVLRSEKLLEQQLLFLFLLGGGEGVKFSFHIFQDSNFQRFSLYENMFCSCVIR